MNALGTLRAETAAALKTATGLKAHANLPASVTAPCYVLQPAEPYVSEGETFGSFEVFLDLIFIAAVGLNSTKTEAVETAIEEAAICLIGEGFSLDSISGPQPLEINGVAYTGCTFSTSININF